MITHLWQSTLFAAVIGLATLAFSKNRAAVRHALWLAASAKFLVPFAALVAAGGAIGVRTTAPGTIRHETVIVVSDPNHPISLPVFDVPAPPPPTTDAASAIATLAPVAAVIWLGGALLILGMWVVRWRRVATIARSAVPIQSGRAFDALRALERRSGRARPIPLLSSDAPLEPGVFGILRPVLVWPKTIADHLAEDQIVSILAHEVSHVRRRDNLAAALHMVVEALFWFHPIVWWIGARLVDERERACDEAVLQSGSEPEVYAASILEACRVYVEAPLACVAGVTGSDLNRRIERIMTNGPARALSTWRKLLLALAAIAAIATPVGAGVAAPPPRIRVQRIERRTPDPIALRVKRPLLLQVTPQGSTTLPQFEVASIKPNKSGEPKVQIQTLPGGRFIATNVTVRFLLQYAYGLQPSQMIGGPAWLSDDRFDIAATGGSADGNAFEAEKLGAPGRTQLMLRSLLAERFKLEVHAESREMPVFALVLANKDRSLGPQLKRSTLDCSGPEPPKPAANAPPCGIRIGGGPGTMVVGGARMSQLASSLTAWAGRLVVDRTGLEGAFDLKLSWTPDQIPQGLDKKVAAGGLAPADPNGPSLVTAVQEQLGLKLESQKSPVEILVIDRAEHPVEN
ncbi:MAG TPA: M56 family metallopeptidase [Vicinamibacterales bacterium]|nr:M56 family metallopeptidase [Vicinamibacterales bacterium]